MDAPTVVVHLHDGASLRGKTSFAKEEVRPVYEFLGVPYAQPPVGEGRFQPPKPLQLWEGERDAVKYGCVCPQDVSRFMKRQFLVEEPPTGVSEDCLFLNVFTPTLHKEAGLPVMFFIHGGSLNFGSGEIYRGTALCSYNDVVMVSINYRVGLFGFLSTGDDVAPGNYAFLDQIEALRWVKKYIRAFGGDPDNVTIYGESAGGLSVAILLMADLARGLFKRAISQSGGAYRTGFPGTQKQAGCFLRKQLAKAGFTSDSSHDILLHLHSLSHEELRQTLGDEHFRPVLDGHVLRSTMSDLYQEPGGIANAEYLLGCNTHEYYIFMTRKGTIKDRATARQMIAADVYAMNLVPDKDKAAEFARLAMEAYLAGVDDGDERGLMEGLVDLFSDCVFVVPMLETARLHSGLSPTYFYYFTHRPSFSVLPNWAQSDHANELFYTMGSPLTRCKLNFTEQEAKLSRMMMNYWANFARTGNPNGPGLPVWPQYTLPQRQHLTLDTKPTVGEQLRGDKEKFWRQDALPLMMPGLV